jgi:hypothetical protein
MQTEETNNPNTPTDILSFINSHVREYGRLSESKTSLAEEYISTYASQLSEERSVGFKEWCDKLSPEDKVKDTMDENPKAVISQRPYTTSELYTIYLESLKTEKDDNR